MTVQPTVTIELDGRSRVPACADVTWTRTAPGGCASAELTILDPHVADRVSSDAPVIISHPATGRTLFNGVVRDPGRRAGSSGHRDGKVTVAGNALALADRTWNLPYKVSGVEPWTKEDIYLEMVGTPARDRQHGGVSTTPTADSLGGAVGESIRLDMSGETLQYDKARARLTPFEGADMTIGYYRLDYNSGFSAGVAANWRFRVVVGAPVAGDWPVNEPPEMFDAQSGRAGVTALFPAGKQDLRLELEYVGAPTLDISQSSYRANVYGIEVLGSRVDSTGSTVVPSSNVLSIATVVEDLCGRSGLVDPDRLVIDSGFSNLDALTVQSSVYGALTDMLAFDFGKVWVLGPTSHSLAPFEWREWGEPRYVLSQATGQYVEQVSDDEVCARVIVRFQHSGGLWATPEIQVADPDLYPATRPQIESGRLRDAETIVLPRGTSRSQAVRVASQRLEQVATVNLSATYGTSQPVLDLYTGDIVDPLSIEPGWVAVVQESGVQLQMTQALYDGDNGTVNLTLGQPVRGLDEVVSASRRTSAGVRR